MKKLRKEWTYVELKHLAAMDWKEMIDWCIETLIDRDSRDFYLKKAREDHENLLIQVLEHSPDIKTAENKK